ncbi:hypothetical protein PROFUN_07361 [Planoprotostelium fungivorum]|uniref:Uncharacterized protein n=1 Tax=Planoprotostelium fungivorum TaxID=1890364 RepID=A0A2P6NLX7_9EUKA|nr:hypothetical protein PROFUN_07361 [Planoprotostelium fungivorum]
MDPSIFLEPQLGDVSGVHMLRDRTTMSRSCIDVGGGMSSRSTTCGGTSSLVLFVSCLAFSMAAVSCIVYQLTPIIVVPPSCLMCVVRVLALWSQLPVTIHTKPETQIVASHRSARLVCSTN